MSIKTSSFKQNFTDRIAGDIKFIASIYVLALLFFFFFRLLFFITQYAQIESIPDNRISLILNAFIMGVRFDLVVIGYLLIIPAGLLFLNKFIHVKYQIVAKIISLIIGIAFTIAFLICAADIPFYAQFLSRFNATAFNWLDSPAFMMGMIFQEIKYWIFFIPFIILSLIFWSILLKFYRKAFFTTIISERLSRFALLRQILISVLVLLLMLLGIRGRVSLKSPIHSGTASFSQYPFPNQLGLNPVFTLFESWLNENTNEDALLAKVSQQDAFRNIINSLAEKPNAAEVSPIARSIVGNNPLKANVVLIVMESMTAENMKCFGNKQSLTPFLDSLAYHSIMFSGVYTAGIHTYNGLYSTLYSYPALLRKHLLNVYPIPEYYGLPQVLQANDYQTMFVTTHDEQFDNMGGFFRNNGFSSIVSQKDFPSDMVRGTMGVPDHTMFDLILPKLDSMGGGMNPFFTCFLTASNHGPYVIPEDCGFAPRSTDKLDKAIEYADWSLCHFIDLASKKPWFKNTLFVFIADHGAAKVYNSVMPLSYHHSPLIFYAPYLIPEPVLVSNIGSQMDVFPSIMGFLRQSYVNNTFGIDLINEKRKYAMISADDRVGCVDGDFQYVYFINNGEFLFNYKAGDLNNYISIYKSKADSMRQYVFSTMSSAWWLIQHQKTKVKP